MASYDFELILSRPLFESELDPLFQRTQGRVTVGFVHAETPTEHPGQAGCNWPAPSLAAAVMEVIEHVEASAPGLRVLRIETDPLLTMPEIAERVGHSLEMVRLSIRGARGPGGFPAAETSNQRHRMWRWSDVARWYRIDDPRLREARPTAHAINGWLALREVVPDVAPEPMDVASALSAVLRDVA